MKNLKNNYIIIVTCLFILNSSCSNQNNDLEPTKSEQVKKINVANTTEVSIIDEDFLNFKKSESYEILKANVPNFIFTKIQNVTFDDESVKGLIISLPNEGEMERELMIAFKTEDTKLVTAFIREKSIKNSKVNNNQVYNGQINWLRADYSPLNEMTVTNSKITNFKMYTSGVRFSLKNARFASIQSCSWQCTSADFNCEYQAAKDTCEREWDCDFACSFNPCAIAYVAVAIIACTVCN
jgi:hypothetical protein